MNLMEYKKSSNRITARTKDSFLPQKLLTQKTTKTIELNVERFSITELIIHGVKISISMENH